MPRRRIELPPPLMQGGGPSFNVIGNGRFSSALQRFLGIRGGAPAPSLSPDVMATYEIDDYSDGRAFLLGVMQSEAAGTSAAVAARFSQVSITNPPGSGMIFDVTNLAVSAANAVNVVLRSTGTTGAVGNPRPVDSRWGFNVRPAATIAFGDDAALSSEPPQRLLFFSATGFPTAYQLVPGSALLLHVSVANVALTWALSWNERLLRPEELISG